MMMLAEYEYDDDEYHDDDNSDDDDNDTNSTNIILIVTYWQRTPYKRCQLMMITYHRTDTTGFAVAHDDTYNSICEDLYHNRWHF